ncbi:conserved hypothetical protein [Nostocoides japonicum T1-X7]|uniref:Tetratricopeptide repeat protein n=1 Tax=Nostocoides japonicum T1-X7 TaxID=1194083 RepID=A0A077LSU4_9MICO|nr:tetratricopeptide repeat protein [Tetrasphaera japonica]CCH76263.1 conserved hypothetical protein [Tetrasphaera japonica T1-X7]
MSMYAMPTPSAYDLFRSAQRLFARKRYLEASHELEALLGHPDACDPQGHGVHDARQLLARAYYHSAQLSRAEGLSRAILEDHPDDAYTMLLLGRTLQRAHRGEEARGWLHRAEVLGQSLT